MDEPASIQNPATSRAPISRLDGAVAREQDHDLRRLAILGFTAAVLLRLALLPSRGFSFDLDQFVLWAHDLTRTPLGEAYRLGIPYPPVLVYALAALGALDPVFRTAVAGTSAAVTTAIKLPATLADIGLAAGVAYGLRDRPRWALYGALAMLLTPALWYLSAWWGQLDSLYLLPAVVAYLLAVSGRPVPGSVALAFSLMAKPQALPLLVPFVAWSLGSRGLRTTVAAGGAFVATVLLLWLPFLADGGLQDFLLSMTRMPTVSFNVISFQAWNPWWLAQLVLVGNPRPGDGPLAGIVSNSTVLVAPFTLNVLGYVLAGIAEMLVFVAVLRRPTARTLALGLVSASLVAFELLTAMHERYDVAAIVFAALLMPDTRARWLWAGLSGAISANIMASIPSNGVLQALLPPDGVMGIVGSLAMIALSAWSVLLLVQEPAAARVGSSMLARPVALVRRRREQILYLVFGGWNTVFGYGIWALLQFALGERIPYLAIVVLSWPIAVLNAYVVYRYFVFRSRGPILREFPRFSLVYLATLLVNLALLPVALRVLPFSIYVVQALFLAVVVVCSYLGHRYFSFGGRHRTRVGDPTVHDGPAAGGG